MGSKAGNFFKFIFSLQFLKHLGIALAVIIVGVFVLMIYLRSYTNHGDYVSVPSIKNIELTKGIEVLEALDLKYQVIDSVYLPKVAPGTIVEQIPSPNEKIKHYRQVYLVINSYKKPKVSLPDVRDLSYRNAKATLEAIGFIVDEVQYVPSEFKNLVKGVKLGSGNVAPGVRVARGSHITLVVGRGTSGSEIPVPSYRGLSYKELFVKVDQDSLNIRSVEFDEVPKNKADSALFVVYKQSPIKGTPVYTGTSVNFWLTKNKKIIEEETEKEYEAPIDSTVSKQKVHDIEEFDF